MDDIRILSPGCFPDLPGCCHTCCSSFISILDKIVTPGCGLSAAVQHGGGAGDPGERMLF